MGSWWASMWAGVCGPGYGDASDMVGSGDMETYYLWVYGPRACGAVKVGEYYAGAASHLYTNIYLYIQIYKQYEPIPEIRHRKVPSNTYKNCEAYVNP